MSISSKIMCIDSDIYEKISKNITQNGSECTLNKEILNYKRKTTETEIGKLLYSYLTELCECSELYKRHSSESLPRDL